MSPNLPPIAVLAGGMATRLRPITTTIPKALVDVAGEPFIAHQLRRLKSEGLHKVVLCLGHQGVQVEEYVGNGSAFGLQVSYSYDGETLLGTGGALFRALPQLGKIFYVTYGDTLLDVSYAGVYNRLQAHPEALGTITVLRNDNQWDTSNMEFDGTHILAYEKKAPTARMHHIDYGLSLLRSEVLSGYHTGQKFDLGEVFTSLIGAGKVLGYEVTKRFYEIGTPESLQETARYLREQKSAN
ncbi:NTP transferase domain-containing protein [bacterium]|nr:NTP transferase domain-containing protein [bacterium]